MFDDSILQRLRTEAMKSSGRYRHAAVILTKNLQPICYGHNSGMRHAEHHTISKLLSTPSFRGKKPSAILVVRVRATGFSYSRPCRKCMKMLGALGLQVFHS